jgi:hypothetical protein
MISPESLRAKVSDEEMNFIVAEFLEATYLSREWERVCSEIQAAKGSVEERVSKMITGLRSDFKYKLFWKLRGIVNDDLMDEREWASDLEDRLKEICDGESEVAALLGYLIDGLVDKIRAKFDKATVKLHNYHKPGLPTYIFEMERDGVDYIIHIRFHEESLDLDFSEGGTTGFDYDKMDPDKVVEDIGKFIWGL